MALIRENDLTEGMSGKFGRKFVFRVVKGVTVASRRSTVKREATEKQLASRERFQRAAQYARAKMLDPAAKEMYKAMAGDEAFANPFAAAVKDYLVPPKILSVEVSEYTGEVGSTIPIKVSDNLKTIQLRVAILTADGSTLESGEATLSPGDVDWKYITTQALPVLAGSKIVVTAIDRPGNQTVEEKVIT